MAWRVRAGLLMYRVRFGGLEVFLGHQGSPTSGSEDAEEWTIPKGGQARFESLLQAAQREFEEEVGFRPRGPYLDLGSIQQKNGKVVHVWAFEGDWNADTPIRSHLRETEWPPASGQTQLRPELDQARFFSIAEAREKLRGSQRPFLDRLEAQLKPSHSDGVRSAHS